MQRDILFFVRGIPLERRIGRPAHFFMEPLDERLHQQMYETSDPLPTLRTFLGSKPDGLMLVGFRNDCPDETTAVERAHKRLEGIFDGLAFIIDGAQPEVCPVIKIREGNASDAKLMRYAPHMWIHLQRPGSDSPAKWRGRCDSLFKRLIVFFEMAVVGDPVFENELGYQIVCSAKMFRCGTLSEDFGVEYLCKFSALEGLVCGPVENGKHKMLKERLATLFRGDRRDIEKQVSKLWGLRCEASHQAKAFHDETLPQSKPLQCETVTLENLITGALVFALDHLGKVKTVDDLWAKVSTYDLPAYARTERPGDMHKLPMLNFLASTPLRWRDAGVVIDAAMTGPQPAAK